MDRGSTTEYTFLLVVSLAVLISAARMKVPPYDEPRTALASARRALKVMGIMLGMGGILISVRGLLGL